MPIYEFRCKKCKLIFEELVLYKKQEIVCPGCKSKDVEKLMSAAVQLGGESKGGGSSCSSCSSGNCSSCH